MPDMHDVLASVFGFDAFRAGQQEAVEALLAGEHLLAVMPTGAGKSLCFQVPALVKGGLCLVVSPLVALMKDQVAGLRLAGVGAETLNSAQTPEENAAAWQRVRAGESRFLYLAPERLMTADMLEALKTLPITLIAVDEAHCISQWGPAFRPEYEQLSELRTLFPGVPIAALTATADALTREDIVAKLFDGQARTIVLGFDRANISLAVEPKRGWKKQLLAFLEAHKGESGIVYCLSRKKTEEAAAHLAEHGFRALPYHASMDKEDRDANQNSFMSEPGVIVCATIAFGMGIDKADVRFVFHADLPGSVEAYYQEIGRAGRDGAPAAVHMLYGLDDIRMRRVFIEEEDSDAARKLREHKRLDALIAYCEAPECRRRALLGYFGEALPGPCGNCDVCLNPVELRDGTVEGQKALSAVYRSGQRFGAAHIVDILRGVETEKITRAGHDRLPTFGVGADLAAQEWRSLIRQLVAAGFLHLDIANYGGLKITEKGAALLKGGEAFRYRPDVMARTGAAKRVRAAASDVPAASELADDQAVLLDRLKQLRLELAKARGVPAYVIFPDKALIDMVFRHPKDREAFAEVHGVGEAKLRDFADAFLEVLNAG